MRERDLEALFERFRAKGETTALGQVFDHTAPELLGVARHLLRDKGDAEDLLQTTFLTAIERRDSFDATRRIRPWLLGILVNHIHSARRHESRFLEAARLEPVAPREPHEILAESELSTEVERALKDLPPIYREVLEPRLHEGKRGSEIATGLDRDPAVVRSQIKRGLSMLRGALPRGLFASLAMTLWSRRALAATRTTVLRRATLELTGTVEASSVLIGGMIVSKKSIALAATVIATLTSGIYLGWPDATQPSLVSSLTAAQSDQVEIKSSAIPAKVDPASQRVGVDTPPRATADTTLPEAYQRALSGITGRLLHADGNPAIDFEVTFLELRSRDIFGFGFNEFATTPPDVRFELASCQTDDEGQFTLQGAHGRAFHALGIDLAGPNAAIRVIDNALSTGKTLNLGDITLDPVIAITGLVVDADGHGIEGARVRAAVLPGPIGIVGGQHVRSDSQIVQFGSSQRVIDAPPWARRFVDRLPIPTTTTDRDGKYRIAGGPRGLVTVVIDHPEYTASVLGPRATGSRGELDLRTTRLSAGRTVTVYVTDADGRAVTNADVLLGPTAGIAPVAICRQAREDRNEPGSYHLDHLPRRGKLALAVRRSNETQWQVEGPFDDDEFEVTLEDAINLAVKISDQDGAPVSDAKIRLTPTHLLPIRSLRSPYSTRQQSTEEAKGQYLIADVRASSYELVVQAQGFAALQKSIVVSSENSSLELTLSAGRQLSVTVLDDATGKPIDHAEVTLHHRGLDRRVLTGGFTDTAGHTAIGPAAVHVDGALTLWVEHPGYASTALTVPAEESSFEVRMLAGGTLLGRVTEDQREANRQYFIVFSPRSSSIDSNMIIPWLANTKRGGEFKLSNLPAGSYSYKVFPRLLAGDPIKAAKQMEGAEPIMIGTVDILAGERTECHIDVATEHSTCVIKGVVTRNGQPMTDARVQAMGRTDRWGYLDSSGRYTIDKMPPGEITLRLYSMVTDGSTTTLRSVQEITVTVAPGEELVHNFNLEVNSLSVTVLNQDGKPVNNADVELSSEEPRDGNSNRHTASSTDKLGNARLDAHGSGRYRLTVNHSESGSFERRIKLPATKKITVNLDPGVPCAGKFSTPSTLVPPPAYSTYLLFKSTEPGNHSHWTFRLGTGPSPQGTFSIAGLQPGSYSVEYGWGTGGSKAIDFVLPVRGHSEFEFKFLK